MDLYKEAPYSKLVQKMTGRLDCNFRVFSEDCTMEQIMEIYTDELERGRKEGFFPVLVSVDDILVECLGMNGDDGYTISSIINSADGNAEEILKEQYQEYINDYLGGDGEGEPSGEEMENFLGELDNGEEICEFSSLSDETILFEIPVDEPWKIIAYLPMGGWNDCPEPGEMITICRYWYEKYGAIPAVVTHDTLEFFVEKPVMDEEEAWKLAKEHFVFCPDRVFQCTESYQLGEVADCLIKSKVWFFWWD